MQTPPDHARIIGNDALLLGTGRIPTTLYVSLRFVHPPLYNVAEFIPAAGVFADIWAVTDCRDTAHLHKAALLRGGERCDVLGAEGMINVGNMLLPFVVYSSHRC